ncbi:hypothetical protein [Sphingomonas floccifaciens]|uniref:hypothetical protein n=1 Tax=Sphingomonas floccifaciens TaxID=1844115 RepID=UPI0036D25288
MQILRDAAHRSADMPVGTIEVRLALHVLRPFVREKALLTDYWKAATLEPRHPWSSCHKPYRAIVERLVAMKVDVESGNLP